uniref:Toll-like receptor 8-like n=1 Tax=Saccoglossus kowalevskii TaxID=10224 RepID=A0ABM0M239_SACKO|nr:PREDICTED: toll-like receptor 8-like [Saccoglossus kowalevskii]
MSLWSLILLHFLFCDVLLGDSIPRWKIYNGTYLKYTTKWPSAAVNSTVLKTIPRDANITHLYIVDSGLVNITQESFKGLIHLKELDLSHNPVMSMENNSFADQGYLLNLSLARNAIFLESGGDCSRCSFNPHPNVFKGLTNLTRLDLTLTGVCNVTKELFTHLRSLQSLLLGSNCYNEFTEDTFDHLRNLRLLNLSATLIESLPSGIFSKLTNLRALYISPSKLKVIPNDALAPVPLNKLYIGGRFTHVEFDDNFSNKILQTVAINACMTSNTPFAHTCGLLNITQTSFRHLTTKRFIHHQLLGLDSVGIKTLFAYPPRATYVMVNYGHGLAGKFLTPDLFKESADIMTKMETFDLGHLNIIGIKNNTFLNFSNLRILTLANNDLISINIESNAFMGLSKLEKLYLDSNSLSTVPTLQGMSSLKKLHLSGNQLNPVIKNSTFKDVPNLEELSLANSHIGDSTLNGLVNLSSLISLYLSGNNLNYLPKVVHSLSTMTKLEILELSENAFIRTPENVNISLSSLKHLTKVLLGGYAVDLKLLINVTSLKELHLKNPPYFDIVNSWLNTICVCRNFKYFTLFTVAWF